MAAPLGCSERQVACQLEVRDLIAHSPQSIPTPPIAPAQRQALGALQSDMLTIYFGLLAAVMLSRGWRDWRHWRRDHRAAN